MHLKSLTLKGFKSFAQATTFAFEPGVTCIVGPNGSGKSNVVDALAWVMGEQGAKNLRGGSMADVIFAGTATRGPLGRAEVVLTIDNADGALPIEYGEVAISRTLFRDGRSEYAINGDGVRLLDVQELLSDSGLGREMHVIVGQGQLDAVLRAGPEERRGFIEEAAGILKHRRRRERTLRKLESMQANLARLTDLAEELRRQLKPLGAQAEIAREAAGVQAAAREARTRLLAFDAARLAHEADRARSAHEQAEAGRQVAADSVQRLGALVERLERGSDDGLDAARRTALQLEGVQQRFRDLAQTAAQRVAMLGEEPAAVVVDTGAAEREAATTLIADLERRIAEAGPRQREAATGLERARAALDEVDRRIAEAAAAVGRYDREAADAARLAATAETRLQSAAAEAQRRRAAAAAARDRASGAAAALAAAPAPDVPESETPLPDLGAVDRAAEEARAALHALEREASAAQARLATLHAATVEPPAVAAVLAALPGSVRLQDALEVEPEWRIAVAAVLGAVMDAALLPPGAAPVESAEAAASLGAVDLVARAAEGGPLEVPGVSAASVVRAPDGVLRLLDGVALAEDLADARAAVDAGARLAATRDGALLTATRLRTPGGSVPGVQLRAERDDAEQEVARLAALVAEARTVADETRAARRTAATERDRVIAQQRDRDRAARLEAERSATLRARADAAHAEAERAERQAAEAEAALVPADAARDEARAAAAATTARERPVLDADVRVAPARAVEAAQQTALEARLGAETLRERLRAEQQRLAALDRRALEAERARLAAARRAAERAVQREAAEAVLAEVPAWQSSVDRSAAEAATRLAHREHERRERDTELRAARTELASARKAELETDHRVRDLDMRAYELQVSLGAVRDRAATELGLDARALAAEADESLDRAEEERRLAAAERRLGRLGRVNPLALEEFEALEQRHRFLGEQLDDLQRTRTDLLAIVDDLDARMRQIFASAYADTEAAFARIFPVLFPGGAGRLTLTEDEEPGVEISVRPAGKKIERLSLLSGGERSLAAVAFLLAIFTARPSPFYILDEVEAALDDANLGRLLDVVSSLRDSSQLILITHQKRTMEIADALYGVSMRQDGVSAVIGQRLAART